MAVKLVAASTAEVVGEAAALQQRFQLQPVQLRIDTLHERDNARHMRCGHRGAVEKGVGEFHAAVIGGAAGTEDAVRVAIAVEIGTAITTGRANVD